jgi:hypothetical protein
MSPAIQKQFVPGAGVRERGLNIFVVFTSAELTLPALKEATSLASGPGDRITLLVPQVARFPLQLDTPPVPVEFCEQRCREMVSQIPVETSVHIYLCRDKLQTLLSALKPGSLVILCGRTRRWWPTRDEVLARALRRAGHEVIFKGME